MKIFVRQGYRIASLPVPAKLLYSFFLIFILIGLWTSWVLYDDRLADKKQIHERYVNETVEPPAAVESEGGPVLELEPMLDEPALDGVAAPETDLKGPWVMDVFHQHVFSVSVVWLILAHLFMLVPLVNGLKGAGIVVSGGSALLHVLAPPIIWKTGGSEWLMPWSGAAMGLTWTAMVVITLVAMWFGRTAK